MNRSGSTWLFNAVRLLLEQAGVPDLGAGWIADREALLGHGTVLIKTHQYDPGLLAARWPCAVLVSHRDPRDVMASMVRKFRSEPTLALTRYIVDQYREWSRHAIYDMPYEAMITDPLGELRGIAKALGLSAADCMRVRAELDVIRESIVTTPPEEIDATTLLHANHITDGRLGSWRGQLSPALVAEIEEDLGPWMAAKGYLAAGGSGDASESDADADPSFTRRARSTELE